MELLIVTGMSGAGKSAATDALEDIGYYCVDNIPPSLILPFVDIISANEEISRAAVVTDVRVGSNFKEITSVFAALDDRKINYKILFLDCEDSVLCTRYKETRRKHPLCAAGIDIMQAVQKERKLLKPVRQHADYIFDTSKTTAKQTREQLIEQFSGAKSAGMAVRVMSFGFKYGAAHEADLLFDVRCLPNPYYVEELRSLTGLNDEIKKFVLNNEIAGQFKERLISFIEYAAPLYCSEGKSQLVIAVGCTGGKHRSVVFAELVAEHLRNLNYSVSVSHRDIIK